MPLCVVKPWRAIGRSYDLEGLPVAGGGRYGGRGRRLWYVPLLGLLVFGGGVIGSGTPQRTRPHRPQTSGKIERFHRTLSEGWAYARRYDSTEQRNDALPGWLHFYKSPPNRLRPRRPATSHPTDQPPWASQLARLCLPGTACLSVTVTTDRYGAGAGVHPSCTGSAWKSPTTYESFDGVGGS